LQGQRTATLLIPHFQGPSCRSGNNQFPPRIELTVSRRLPRPQTPCGELSHRNFDIDIKENTDDQACRILTLFRKLYSPVVETDNNFGGVGALASLQAFKEIKLEAQMSYDFNQTFTEGFTDTGTVNFSRTNMRTLHGEFGPASTSATTPIQPFVTLKGGFVDFRIDGAPPTLGTFFSSVNGLRSVNVNGVLYPGGGLQGHLGPIGLRLANDRDGACSVRCAPGTGPTGTEPSASENNPIKSALI
jgi:hypothetical protein